MFASCARIWRRCLSAPLRRDGKSRSGQGRQTGRGEAAGRRPRAGRHLSLRSVAPRPSAIAGWPDPGCRLRAAAEIFPSLLELEDSTVHAIDEGRRCGRLRHGRLAQRLNRRTPTSVKGRSPRSSWDDASFERRTAVAVLHFVADARSVLRRIVRRGCGEPGPRVVACSSPGWRRASASRLPASIDRSGFAFLMAAIDS